jgi:hypothetical protein
MVLSSTELKTIESIDLTDFPSIYDISSIDRGIELEGICGDALKGQRLSLKDELEKILPNFVISLPYEKPAISFLKLIEESEVILHEEAFVQAARDYRKLARTLAESLAQQLGIAIDPTFPDRSFRELESGQQQGLLDRKWKYCFNGMECSFINLQTGQDLDVKLNYPDEYGVLDPYYFVNYIITSGTYHNLDLKIYDAYRDGSIILNVLEKRGRLIRIQSSETYHSIFGLVVNE